MPRLGSDTDEMMTGQIGGSGFNFSGTRIEHLTATEYTLATIAVDETGSVLGFAKQLKDCLLASVAACQKSPRSDNILLRVLYFGSQYAHGVNEIHGFKPLADIDLNSYPDIVPSGTTPLNDTVFSAVGATNAYGKDLRDQDYNVNGILFVITDGGENSSTLRSPGGESMIRQEIEDTLRKELLESLISILIGVNVGRYSQLLQDYQAHTGMTHYRDAGNANANELAKLGNFISQSISSQSQHLGTGGPSQQIAASI